MGPCLLNAYCNLEVELKLDIITGESRGFAFVSFADEAP